MIPSLFFTADVAHASDLSAVLRDHDIKVYPVSGKTPTEERRRLVRLFKEGAIDGLASCEVLAVGFDAPMAMGAFLTRDTKSALWYRQAVGRVFRPYPAPQGDRPYQSDCLRAIHGELLTGTVNHLLVLPTGTGKTVVAAKLPMVLREWKKGSPRGRILFLVHRDELAFQTADTFRAFNPKMKIGIEKADSRAPYDADLIVASIQTLGPMKNECPNERLASMNPSTFDAVISDEAHWGVKSIYHHAIYKHMRVLKESEHRDPGILHAGFTATPNRADNIGLEVHYDKIVFNYDLRTAITDGWLTDIHPYRVETTVDISKVATQHGDFSASGLSAAINTPERNKIVAEKYLEICRLEGMAGALSNIGQWHKPHAVLVDFVDISGKHSLITAPTLFALRSNFDPEGKSLVEQVKRIEKLEEANPGVNLRDETAPNMDAIEATLRRVDVLRPPEIPTEVRKYSHMPWAKDSRGGYYLPLPGGTALSIRENGLGQFELSRHNKGVRQSLHMALNLKEACFHAEKTVPERDRQMLRADAGWRTDAPSEAQARMLWGTSKVLRKKFGSAQKFYDFAKARFKGGDLSYSKGSISEQINAATAARA